jgi:hypothetical protein
MLQLAEQQGRGTRGTMTGGVYACRRLAAGDVGVFTCGPLYGAMCNALVGRGTLEIVLKHKTCSSTETSKHGTTALDEDTLSFHITLLYTFFYFFLTRPSVSEKNISIYIYISVYIYMSLYVNTLTCLKAICIQGKRFRP